MPPMAGLQDICATRSRFMATMAVLRPRRAHALAASHPAWPAPTTTTSNFSGIRYHCIDNENPSSWERRARARAGVETRAVGRSVRLWRPGQSGIRRYRSVHSGEECEPGVVPGGGRHDRRGSDGGGAGGSAGGRRGGCVPGARQEDRGTYARGGATGRQQDIRKELFCEE